MRSLISRALLILSLILSGGLAAYLPTQALAKTPDGYPPSQENVCDQYRDPNYPRAAFGLCNAYCEAMDCDSDEPRASEVACDKVWERFYSLTEKEYPCEAEE